MFEEAKFSVEERDVFISGGIQLPKIKAIWRPDKNICLGLKTAKYDLVKHGDFLDQIMPVLEEKHLTDSSLHVCQNGGIMFCKFFSETNYKEEIKNGDIVRFGIEIFNSYNGVLRCGAMLIAERLVCSNGMIVSTAILNFSLKHIGNISVVNLKEKIAFLLNNIKISVTNYKRWSETVLPIEKVESFFNNYFGKKESKNLFDSYKGNKNYSTVWDLYNFITAWLSHDIKTRGKNKKQNMRLLQWKKELPITRGFIKEFN